MPIGGVLQPWAMSLAVIGSPPINIVTSWSPGGQNPSHGHITKLACDHHDMQHVKMKWMTYMGP